MGQCGEARELNYKVTLHLVGYRTAVETRTNSSAMRTRAVQHSQLPCMHTLLFAWFVAYRNPAEIDDITAHLLCIKAALHCLLEGFSFPYLPNILDNNFSISISISGRFVLESKILCEVHATIEIKLPISKVSL